MLKQTAPFNNLYLFSMQTHYRNYHRQFLHNKQQIWFIIIIITNKSQRVINDIFICKYVNLSTRPLHHVNSNPLAILNCNCTTSINNRFFFLFETQQTRRGEKGVQMFFESARSRSHHHFKSHVWVKETFLPQSITTTRRRRRRFLLFPNLLQFKKKIICGCQIGRVEQNRVKKKFFGCGSFYRRI